MLLRETTVIELSDGDVGFENVGVGDIDVDIGVNVDVVTGPTRCRGSPLC